MEKTNIFGNRKMVISENNTVNILVNILFDINLLNNITNGDGEKLNKLITHLKLLERFIDENIMSTMIDEKYNPLFCNEVVDNIIDDMYVRIIFDKNDNIFANNKCGVTFVLNENVSYETFNTFINENNKEVESFIYDAEKIFIKLLNEYISNTRPYHTTNIDSYSTIKIFYDYIIFEETINNEYVYKHKLVKLKNWYENFNISNDDDYTFIIEKITEELEGMD
jgi:hypothetical protein